MKKFFALLLACALLCGGACAYADAAEYDFDRTSHWTLDENGEKANEEAHSLSDDDFCSVCGAEVLEFDDGSAWVSLYDDYGFPCRFICYGEDGVIYSDAAYEYTYDENGNLTNCKTYSYGVLTTETVYGTIEDEYGSYNFTQSITQYNDDGTRCVVAYDENGWDCAEELYNADGTLAYSYTIVNEFDENDQIVRIAKMDGDTVAEETLFEYDENGNTVSERNYVSGELRCEYSYTTIEDDGSYYGYVSKKTVYNADGTQTVTEYNEYGEEIE